MTPEDLVVRADIGLALDPATAFDTVVDELTLELARFGIHFDPGPEGRMERI